MLRGYRASSSYLPQNFVRIHAHRLRKYGVSRDYSLSINMDFPTLMLRRHRTSSRYLYHKAVKAMGVHVLQVSYFGQLLFRAIALQTRELADTPNGFEGSSIAAIHSFAQSDTALVATSSRPLRFRRSSIATTPGRMDRRFNQNSVTAWHQISLILSKHDYKIKYEYLCLYRGGSRVFWRQIGDHISRRLWLLVRLPSLPTLALRCTGA